jgi:hypothetical protein
MATPSRSSGTPARRYHNGAQDRLRKAERSIRLADSSMQRIRADAKPDVHLILHLDRASEHG